MAKIEGWTTRNTVEMGLCVIFLAAIGYAAFTAFLYTWPILLAFGAGAVVTYMLLTARANNP